MNTEAIFSQDGITAVSSQIQQLKTLFPACFDKDGRFLIDKFGVMDKTGAFFETWDSNGQNGCF